MKYTIIESGVEKNELNMKARGGTELMQERLHGSLPSELLEKFQIIPSRVRDIDPDKKAVLWLHDLPGDPESEHLRSADSRKRFSKIVCVSDWQMQMYNLISGVPYNECVVVKNAINPIDIKEKEYDGTVRLIYHTTPHRGLGILVPVFYELAKKYDNIELDVYSSFSIYGWSERDAPYQDLFKQCEDHPRINYHGAVPNEEIREALKRSHIFAYPCIWPETSCLAAIEAMSAMNVIVAPNYAALPETTAGFADMYQFTENSNDHANRFATVLDYAIKSIIERGPDSARLGFQKSYADVMYGWQGRASQWEGLLKSMVSQT